MCIYNCALNATHSLDLSNFQRHALSDHQSHALNHPYHSVDLIVKFPNDCSFNCTFY